MGQVRYVTYSYEMTIAAAGTDEKFLTGLLRDILPDKAFEVLWIEATASCRCGEHDGTLMQVGKNITPKIAIVDETLTTLHGLMIFWNHVKEFAENVPESWTDQIVFDEPVDFDQDDQLNVRLYSTNVGTAEYVSFWVITIGYRER